MKDELITFETAKLAKEKGLNISTYPCYTSVGTNIVLKDPNGKWIHRNHNNSKKGYSAPTQSLLQKWLREEHGIHVDISHFSRYKWSCQIYFIVNEDEDEKRPLNFTHFLSYEEALEKGLQEAFKLI